MANVSTNRGSTEFQMRLPCILISFRLTRIPISRRLRNCEECGLACILARIIFFKVKDQKWQIMYRR